MTQHDALGSKRGRQVAVLSRWSQCRQEDHQGPHAGDAARALIDNRMDVPYILLRHLLVIPRAYTRVSLAASRPTTGYDRGKCPVIALSHAGSRLQGDRRRLDIRSQSPAFPGGHHYAHQSARRRATGSRRAPAVSQSRAQPTINYIAAERCREKHVRNLLAACPSRIPSL